MAFCHKTSYFLWCKKITLGTLTINIKVCSRIPRRKQTLLRGTKFGRDAVEAAAVRRAERIPAIPASTKTKSRLYCEHQQGIQQSPSQAYQKPTPETALHDELVPAGLPLMLPFYSKYSVITRPTLCASSIINVKLGGLQRWEIDGVLLGANGILMEIYSTQKGRPAPLSFVSHAGAKHTSLTRPASEASVIKRWQIQ